MGSGAFRLLKDCCGLKMKQIPLIFLICVLAFLSSKLAFRAEGRHTSKPKPSYVTCKGVGVKNVSLGKGKVISLETPGYNQDFRQGCEENWSITLHRDNHEYGQWRIKIDVFEMNLPCSSTSLRIIEDGSPKQDIEYCNYKASDHQQHIFFSHEHLVELKFTNNQVCNENDGCFGVGAKLRISAEYVCGGTFRNSSELIESPFYPLNYPPSTACIYDIRADVGATIELTCTDFNLSLQCEAKKCAPGDRDYLMDLSSLKKYVGQELAQDTTIRSKNHHLTLYFISNAHVLSAQESGFGFSCTFKFI